MIVSILFRVKECGCGYSLAEMISVHRDARSARDAANRAEGVEAENLVWSDDGAGDHWAESHDGYTFWHVETRGVE